MKVGIIGGGRMGAEPSARLIGKIAAGWLPISHLESFQQIEQVSELALCDTDQTVLDMRHKQYAIAKSYLSYQQLITEFQPDIISIATRTPIKADIIRFACQQGVKGIYVEKPLANSLAILADCFAEIKQYGVKLSYGVNRRYHAVYRQAKQLAEQGLIGEVYEVIVEHGEGQLFWSHPHSVDLIVYFLGNTELLSTQARCRAETLSRSSTLLVDSDPIIENAFFCFSRNQTGVISRGSGYNVKVCGTAGNIMVLGDGLYLQTQLAQSHNPAYHDLPQTITTHATTSATVFALTDLITAVNQNQQPVIALNEITAGTQMLMGAVWSSMHNAAAIQTSALPAALTVTGRYQELYA